VRIGIRRVGAGGFSRCKVACLGETQEIPATFTIETSWSGEENCALVTSITIQKEWPLRFRRFPNMRRGVSAVSVGEGWARFMSDQGLGLGALLPSRWLTKGASWSGSTAAVLLLNRNLFSNFRRLVSLRLAPVCSQRFPIVFPITCVGPASTKSAAMPAPTFRKHFARRTPRSAHPAAW
jgi:hypothetical protein